MSNILADTTANALSDNAFEVELSADWAHYFGMLGGYILACAVRPAAALCDDTLQIRSVHALFTAPGQAGTAQGRTELVHRGRSTSIVRTEIHQAGRRVLEATTTLSAVSPGAPEFDYLKRPAAELPFETSHPSHSETDSLWTNSLEGRICIADLEAHESSPVPEAREWLRFRSLDGFVQQPRLASDLACLVVADLLGFIAARHQFDTGRWVAPSVDISVFFHGNSDPSGLYLCESFGRSARSGSLGAETRVWSTDGRLLASAFQTMLFKDRHRSL